MDFSLSSSLVGNAVLNSDNLALDLQFATDKTLTARKGPTPAFARASTGRFVGSNGLIQSAAINAPRFDHDPITGVCKGLLMEESRTNLLIRSEAFNDSVVWTPVRLTAQPTADTEVSPDGATTAERITPDSTVNNNHRIDRATISLALNTVHSFSIFAKSNGYTGFAIAVDAVSPTIGAQFSLVGNGSVTATAAGYTATITPYPNGWYRCTATFTSSATLATHRVYMFVGQNGTTFTYTGDTTSGIILWGAQLETGSFPTSYIPTTGASVVRSADVCSITGSAFSGFYNQSAGTLESEMMIANLIGNNRGIVQIDDNTNNSVLRHVYGLSDGGFRTIIRANADAATTLSTTLGTASVIQKRALAYEGTSFASVTNGGAVTTITRTMPVGLSILRIGNLAEGSFYLSGHIAAIRYYKKRLSNAKLASLTV